MSHYFAQGGIFYARQQNASCVLAISWAFVGLSIHPPHSATVSKQRKLG